MPTLVVLSDLHIGPDGPHRFFGGGGHLASALRALADAHGADLHLVLNGDTLDFLMVEGKLPEQGLADRALDKIVAILGGADGRELVKGLAAVTRVGAKITIRLGNHDPELALLDVQQALVRAVGDEAGTEATIAFDTDAARVIEVGGLRVCLAHGEAEDAFNRFSHAALPERFTYPPGSHVVKDILQPARVLHGLTFLDALKPDFHGAALTAALVRPQTLSLLPGTGRIAFQLLRRAYGANPYALVEDAEPPRELLGGLARAAWERVVDAAALRIRKMARDDAARFFALEPEGAELEPILGTFELGNDVVIEGHTHAARFWTDGRRAYVNTGTWGNLMRLPPPEADADRWRAFYDDLSREPALKNPLFVPTAARVSPDGDGARVELLEWSPSEQGGRGWTVKARSRASTRLAARGPGARRLGHVRLGSLEAAVRADAARWADALEHGPELAVPVDCVRVTLERIAERLEARDLTGAAGLVDLLRQLEEQRRNPDVLSLLHDADAIAWQAQDAMVKWAAGAGLTPVRAGPLVQPLAWMQATAASPLTWPREARAPAPGLYLHASIDLPFQIVVVPADHLYAPWRLASVLHEVGHGVDEHYDLVGKVVADMRAHGLHGWDHWAQEIVADVVAASLGGPAYLSVLGWIVAGIRGEAPDLDLKEAHPPVLLRLALLERFLGSGDAWRRKAEAAGAPQVFFTELLPTLVQEGQLLGLPDLRLREAPEFRGRLEELLGARPSDAPEPDAAAGLVARDRLARAPLTRPPGTLPTANINFLVGQANRLAPASIDYVGVLDKRPRVDLLRDHDHMWFVGATHRNLLPELEKVHALRGRKWATVEIYFVGRDEELAALYPNEPEAHLLPAKRRATFAALVAKLDTLAATWRVAGPLPGALYGSFYLDRSRGADRWYAHTSAPVWGLGIERAPSTDYRSVSPDLSRDPELAMLLDGLRHLRGLGGTRVESDPPPVPPARLG